MIVICDINEIWRERPFAALAEKRDVLGVVPADWMVACRHPAFPAMERRGAMEVLPVALSPGWASRTAWLGQRLLWKRVERRCRELGGGIEAVVVTSPHYHVFLDQVPRRIKTFYYASDDYRSYKAWNRMAALEERMVKRVDHAFFVSEGLMERARLEYGVDPAGVSVSMNATELRFFPEAGVPRPAPPPPGCELPRPLAGVIGDISDRLDFRLLKACADLPELGTLLLVGSLPARPPDGLAELLAHPKCMAVGKQPHHAIHRWFQCLDLGLIPYARMEFNRLCSPTRLFDHLACGTPLVATDACDQIKAFRDRIAICPNPEAFVEAARRGLSAGWRQPAAEHGGDGITWDARADGLLKIMEGWESA